jgi:hypothetical protein
VAHGELRTEKNCLNCNAQVTGQFCSVCGQQNIEPKESFWELMSHFIYDLFHYDGKFVGTMKTLLFKPGVLTFEYVRGRRAGYLHPMRMYVFTSATFFIILISFILGKETENGEDPLMMTSSQQGAINKTIDQLKDTLKKAPDTAKNPIQNEIDALQKVFYFFPSEKNSSFIPPEAGIDSADRKDIDSGKKFTRFKVLSSIAEYDESQAKLPAEKKDGWLLHAVTIKMIEINKKYKYDDKAFLKSLADHFLHSLPIMMFVSLPFVALLFKLVYIRRKQFTYVQHAVFALHIYSAIFIMILILHALGVLNDYLQWGFLKFLIAVGILGIFYYIYKAMRNFYEQGRWKTVVKYGLLLFTYAFVLIILMVIFLLTSLVQV